MFVLCAALVSFSCFNCIPPRSLKQVDRPRTGRALADKVAIVYSRHYQIEFGGLEKLHSFDIRKYARIYFQLITDGLIEPDDVFVPEEVTREQILLVHTPEFMKSLHNTTTVADYLELPIIGAAPKEVVDSCVLKSFRYATGGTILAGREALKYGIAINLAGGYHHAKPHAGEGFSVYADMAIAIRVLKKAGLIKRTLVVDLDVHQGNGTAVIFDGDDTVFTFSMHERGIYPVPKEFSDLDVELSAGTGDAEYLKLLQKHLPRAIDIAQPDIVFLQAGCDTLAGDPLAHLAMTEDGIVRRDAMVIDECVRRGIPVVMTLGGGYSKNAWHVQYGSIRRTIEKYGLAEGGRRPRRRPTAKEKFYTK